MCSALPSLFAKRCGGGEERAAEKRVGLLPSYGPTLEGYGLVLIPKLYPLEAVTQSLGWRPGGSDEQSGSHLGTSRTWQPLQGL